MSKMLRDAMEKALQAYSGPGQIVVNDHMLVDLEKAIAPMLPEGWLDLDKVYRLLNELDERARHDDSVTKLLQITRKLMGESALLRTTLLGYRDAVHTMQAAMNDGINVHGALSSIAGYEDLIGGVEKELLRLRKGESYGIQKG